MPNTYQVVELHSLAHTALELGHKLFTLLQAYHWFWKRQIQLRPSKAALSGLPTHGRSEQDRPTLQHHTPPPALSPFLLPLPSQHPPNTTQKIRSKGKGQSQRPEGTEGLVGHREIMKVGRSVSPSRV